MKYYTWSEQKNAKLKLEREICFEDILVAINDGRLLDVLGHPNPAKYPGQRIYIIEIDNYAYLVPFLEDDEKYFLKTIYPSRKMTKKYLFERRK